MGDLNTDVKGIGEYIASRRLRIPEYQRSYLWGPDGDRDEVKDLWEDLERSIRENQPEYFLGAVVTIRNQDDGRLEVIDGQQRLATVSLLYAAMRDLFAARADERAADIERKFLGEYSFGTPRKMTQFLTLNSEDNDDFRQLTLVKAADRHLAGRLKSQRNLAYAFEFFAQRFVQIVDGRAGEKWADPLETWFDYVRERALILEVSAPEETRGFVIFETLNDRGLNLSTGDLLKSHLFGRAGARLEEVKTRWSKLAAPFDDPDPKVAMDVFLRHYWASRVGVARVKGLFTAMKKTVSTEQEAVDFAEDLQRAARVWTAMFDVGSDVWDDYSSGAVAAVDALRNLNVEQCRPLLLATLLRFDRAETEKVLSLVLSWSVRWLVVGGGGAGTTERLYAEAAKDVTEGKVKAASQLAARFDSAVPSDLAFEGAFATLPVRRSWLARYLLRAVERHMMGTTEAELVPNEDVEQVNLEHVLPKSPDSSWSATFTNDEASVLVWWLGNQCLLAKTVNRDIGNKPFGDKQPIYAGSAFRLTQEVGAQAAWNPKAIRERQAALAALAVRVWTRS